MLERVFFAQLLEASNVNRKLRWNVEISPAHFDSLEFPKLRDRWRP